MTTYNGKHEDLEFSCNSCNNKVTIIINPKDDKQMIELGEWLSIHSECGGIYKNVPARHFCFKCGQEMYEIEDSIAKKKTGYSWQCRCMPKDMVVIFL